VHNKPKGPRVTRHSPGRAVAIGALDVAATAALTESESFWGGWCRPGGGRWEREDWWLAAVLR
jgi:hypothetical protein